MTASPTYFLGKDFYLQREDPATAGTYVTIGGFRTNSFKINGSEIDVTSKDGSRWRKLLTGGIASVDASGSGVFSDDPVLQRLIYDFVSGLSTGGYKGNFRIVLGNGAKLTGQFLIKNAGGDGPHDKENTFSIDVASADAITYTAPVPTVISVTPATGAHGSTVSSVALVGTGFMEGATVKINAVACTSVVVVDGSHITFTAPAQSMAGTYDVVVTNPDSTPSTGGTGLWTST